MQNSSPSVLVCGAGSIGMRHIINLISLGVKVLVWRNRPELVDTLANKLDVKVFLSIDEALMQADAVVIATATNTHLDLALKAAQMKKAIFIEKPISHTVVGVNNLAELVRNNSLVFEVGCQLRAHPNLIKLRKLIADSDYGPLYTYRAVVGQRLEDWRPDVDYRKSYSADLKRGGGALLDLIHEIDLIYWLTGPVQQVSACLAHVSDQEMSAEDLVNMTLINSNGAVGQIQLDMLSPSYRRGLDLVYRDAVFIWDYNSGTLICNKKGVSEVVDKVPAQFERNSLFLFHMKHFVDRLIEPGIPPLCSIDDGVAALCIAECARLSDARNSMAAMAEVIL